MATIELSGKVTDGAGVDLNGLTVNLYTAANYEAAGATTASTTTDSDGLWNFDAVAEGSYIIEIVSADGAKKVIFDGRNEVEFKNLHITTTLQTDTINEATSNTGVTIDGLLIKDGHPADAMEVVGAGAAQVSSVDKQLYVTVFKDTTGKPNRIVIVTVQAAGTCTVIEYKKLGKAWVFDPDDCAYDDSLTLNFTASDQRHITAFAIDSPVSSGNRVVFIAGNNNAGTDTFEIDSIVLTPGSSSLTAVAVVIAGSNQPTDTNDMATCNIPLSTTKVMTFFQDDAHFADITESSGTYTFTYDDAKVTAVDTSIIVGENVASDAFFSGIVIGSQVCMLWSPANFGAAGGPALWEMSAVAVLTQEWLRFQVAGMGGGGGIIHPAAITAIDGQFAIASPFAGNNSTEEPIYIVSSFPLDEL